MVSEGEAVSDGDDVALVFRVVVPKHLQYLYLNFALFVEFLLVLKYFQGDVLRLLSLLCCLVVHAAHDNSESAPAELLHYFISVVDLVSVLDSQIVSVLTIKAIVEDLQLHL